MLENNPFRFKKLKSKLFLFRIRLKLNNKESRLIYTIKENLEVLLLFFDRKKGYKELESIVKKLLDKEF